MVWRVYYSILIVILLFQHGHQILRCWTIHPLRKTHRVNKASAAIAKRLDTIKEIVQACAEALLIAIRLVVTSLVDHSQNWQIKTGNSTKSIIINIEGNSSNNDDESSNGSLSQDSIHKEIVEDELDLPNNIWLIMTQMQRRTDFFLIILLNLFHFQLPPGTNQQNELIYILYNIHHFVVENQAP